MANIKIAQLTNQTAISDVDLVIVETATSTNKMTVGKLKELLGIQSGGIVETGSNANGSWIKFAGGTMICVFQAVVTDQSASVAYGSVFIGTRVWSFPNSFLSGTFPVVTGSVRFGTGLGWIGTGAISNEEVTMYLIDAVERATGVTVRLYYTAIGRWK